MAAVSDLRVDRELIDPNFEGYKLSLDSIPSYRTQLDNSISVANLTEEQYSYHHARLFGVHNHLILDPWCPTDVYMVDTDWNIVKATAFDMSLEYGAILMAIPDAGNQKLVPGRYNISMKFVSRDLAIIADGAGQLHLVDTGNRVDGTQKWKVLLTKSIPGETTPCILADAVEVNKDENHKVECLLVHVSESGPEEKEKFKSQFLTNIDWLTFSSVDRKTWSQERNRKLIGRRPYHYIALDREEPAVVMATESDFVFTFDSEIPVIEEEEEKEEKKSTGHPEYTWYQTSEDVSIQFTVADGVTKADIYLTLASDHVDFGIKNTRSLLKGPLMARVDVDSCTWTIDGQKLELTLCKQEEGMWALVVEGNTRGEMVIDPSEAAVIHQRLAHLTSEEWNPDPNMQERPYNAQQLEECDDLSYDSFFLSRLDGNTHKCTHKANLGSNQWLFNVDVDPQKAPCVCLRHDVDGLLWQPLAAPQGKDTAWSHIATFNAFGYVQASKQTRKFSSCPPDFSYAVISDEARHIYVYRQSTPVSTPLRNRKTGREVKAVAKQQVVSLDSTDLIVGLQATNEKLFILTNKNLIALNVKMT